MFSCLYAIVAEELFFPHSCAANYENPTAPKQQADKIKVWFWKRRGKGVEEIKTQNIMINEVLGSNTS